MYQIDIFCTSAFFALPPVGRFRALGCGARRKLARTLRCKCGPWPRSVARALGVQSRENWQITTGLNSDDVEPTRPIETRNNQIIFKEKEHHICRVCCNPSHHHHHHHQYENEPRAAVAAVVVQAFKYDTAPPPPSSAPSSTDCSFLALHGWHKSQYTSGAIIVLFI